MSIVYVLDENGSPLMPTKRFGKVRRLLNASKAKTVSMKPFTIQLLYEPETKVVQYVTVGIDPGRTNIGVAAVDNEGSCLYMAKVTTRNKEIPKLMRDRKRHRQASRRGGRLARKRLAKRHDTFSCKDMKRVLPGCKKPICPKDIINTEARFNNRKREEGWLTPTATQLLRTHLNVLDKICKILPVKSVVLEINKFAFMALDNPSIKKWQYQSGSLYGKGSVKKAVSEQQNGMCLLCGKNDIEHYHHIVPVSKGGSNTIGNIAGLCAKCHDAVHKDNTAKKELDDKKSGLNKKYGALSVLNQIIPYLVSELSEKFPEETYVTDGYSTKLFRDKFCMKKDHDMDAYAIACSINNSLDEISLSDDRFQIVQYRRHDRARIHSQRERVYKLDGVKVATNRRKREEQKNDSLEDWYKKMVSIHGADEADRLRSRLTVTKSVRHYNRMERILPGAVFIHDGKRCIMGGQQNRGYYIKPENDNMCIPAKDCHFLAQNGGLVYA